MEKQATSFPPKVPMMTLPEKSNFLTYRRHVFLLVIGLALFIAPAMVFKTTGSRFSMLRTNLVRQSRTGRHLIYWTPHKTGSSSMRMWLKAVATDISVPYGARAHFPYMVYTYWHGRSRKMSKGEECAIIAGHIKIPPVSRRPHEGTLGAVISTTRDAMDTLASKHFHRTFSDVERDLDLLKDRKSAEARFWFFYFNDLDPCEQLRYYDGEEGCEKDETLLAQRARNIAERIDCVVDTDDADPDVQVLCELMKVKDCPRYPRVNKAGFSMYDKLFEIDFITDVMERVLRVTRILRTELMKRRCRFLKNGPGLTTPGLEAPKWPNPGCTADR